ncbi:hypothetical protein MAFF211471_34610 [Ralstonia solanacearum]|uniref:Uncharacterized protein n=1 Tax=Ralstonia solanacearum TaxID=305 RepID=A0A0S4XA38_RALSL|nr:protein of unknown function [Ralstonia solanacearum]BEU53205.1 hypothetical protein MAFF211520_34970 [Ralstonia pseudosolanacearum]CUV22106.1 protein of unknown function [Ralstonia solanacearum]CUV28108.1 protein of unknown function [Ralstonia solanacearum]CUV35321.1 protein of unknown function [Ralstonia solanacearum]
MNDLTAADIDAVVLIPFALCHEMRAHGQSLARGGNTLLFVPCGEGFSVWVHGTLLFLWLGVVAFWGRFEGRLHYVSACPKYWRSGQGRHAGRAESAVGAACFHVRKA